MGVPATTGVLRTKIEDMEIGDYIKFYHDGSNYVMSDNAGSRTEIPTNGQASGLSALPMYWYGVKVARGLIVSDRVVRHTWAWDAINNSLSIQSRTEIISGVVGIIRSLTGGVAYADANGNMSLTDKGFGAWPTNNEWDRYIVNFPNVKIQSGKVLDDVWHYKNLYTWVQETTVNGTFVNATGGTAIGANTRRIGRGEHASFPTWKGLGHFLSTVSDTTVGFRPVFEYKEV